VSVDYDDACLQLYDVGLIILGATFILTMVVPVVDWWPYGGRSDGRIAVKRWR